MAKCVIILTPTVLWILLKEKHGKIIANLFYEILIHNEQCLAVDVDDSS